MISCTSPRLGLRVLLASAGLLTATLLAQDPAFAQTAQSPPQPDITTLLNSGYTIVAASSSGLSQFIFLQGADKAGRKKAYACQLQFGPGGGFRGCLVLP